MKSIVIAVLLLSAGAAQASQYNCTLSNGSIPDPKATHFALDTSTEENKFVHLGDGVSVGCAVLRSQPELLSCGLGQGEIFSIAVVAEAGSSVISMQTNSNGSKSNLTCVKTR